jgi:hypothetical protein
VRAERREKMKFLTVSKIKDSAALCPPATTRQLLEATLTFIDAMKKAGKLLEAYAIPEGGTAVICDHPSIEDVAQTIASIPIGGLMSHEVYPLADLDETMKAVIETFKKAEQFSPK